MRSHRLPVSAIDVIVGLPTGEDDMLLVEGGAIDVALALAFLDRVVRREDGRPVDWKALAPTDVEWALLLVRRRVLGDVVMADARCGAAGCGARVDISFSITQFLEHHRPASSVPPADATRDGWLRLGDIEFRLPCAADQVAIAAERDPELALVRRCIRGTPSAEVREQVELAMEAIAPSLVSDLEGQCPECGAPVIAELDPVHFALRELREQAQEIYAEVCQLARHTRWSEAEILALPTLRRLRYVEVVQELA